MNILDRVIATLAPETGARRAKARARMRAYENARALYDGASVSRRTAGWRRVSTDANAEIVHGVLGRLRDTSRDLVRNNPYARRGIDAITHNVVGAGVIPQFRSASQSATDALEAMAVEHLDTTAVDADGRHNLYGLQALAMRAVAESGEVLVRRRRRRPEDGLPLPFALQVLESDFLDSSKNGDMGNGNIAVQGVEFDRLGRRVAYWMFDEHPGSTGTMRLPQSRRVPAQDVAHVYRMDRPGQVRGVPWLAPVILRMHDYADYEDAQLMRQKIAAVFAAFVTDPDGVDRGPIDGETSSANEDRLESLEPGIIEYLPPGKEIKFASPPGVEGYGEYARIQLHAIAAGLGVTYETLTGDLSEVNFSSGRMGWLEFQRSIVFWQNSILINQMCKRVEGWFLEAASVGVGVAAPATATWTPPRREMIDPTKEIPAQRDAVRSGFVSLSDAVRSMGKDPMEHFNEMAEDFARLDTLGLVLDSDPRRVARTGAAQPPDAEEKETNG